MNLLNDYHTETPLNNEINWDLFTGEQPSQQSSVVSGDIFQEFLDFAESNEFLLLSRP